MAELGPNYPALVLRPFMGSGWANPLKQQRGLKIHFTVGLDIHKPTLLLGLKGAETLEKTCIQKT